MRCISCSLLQGLLFVLNFQLYSLQMDGGSSATDTNRWTCDHPIFCRPYEGILHTVQTLHIFKDGKSFVDMPLKNSVEQTLTRFEAIEDKSSKEEVKKFVEENFFEEGSELEEAELSDWKENPAVLNRIQDAGYAELFKELHKRWKHLARKISSTAVTGERSSLIPLQHTFIVPGGRFREIYYWDSFWTIKGLLVSELYQTVQGMLDNFKDLIEQFGHVPNGNRVYFTKRSQPPFYIQMVHLFVQDYSKEKPSQKRELMANYIDSMDKEFQFWRHRFRSIQVEGKEHTLASYNVDVHVPRPESYAEDYEEAQHLPKAKREEWYGHMISGAESGWDYSSRWYSGQVDPQRPLLSIATADVLPVDLNSILYRNAEILSSYYDELENQEQSEVYRQTADELREAIRSVLWNEEDAMWYDYNIKTKQQNKRFYPSNVTPLYMKSHHTDVDFERVLDHIVNSSAVDYPGGLPTSLYDVSEHAQQWDFPNVWPPLVELFVNSLDAMNLPGSRELARVTAEKYVNNVFVSSQKNGTMYEKYNCKTVGKAGSGGEYKVQEGFGWSNGVVMSLLDKYPDMISSAPRVKLNVLTTLVTICLVFFFHQEL